MRLLIEQIARDVHYSVRVLAHNRAFALTALTAIALGVGMTTAVFSVVDRILFRSLPYQDSERLVSVGIVAPVISLQDWLFSATYQDWREVQTPFNAFTSWTGVSDCDLAIVEPVRLNCGRVEATFLSTLGVPPFLGRDFTAADDQPGAEPVVILSHAFWQSQYAGDRRVIGTSIPLDGLPTRVIGVLPTHFELPTLATVDVLTPQALKRGSERQRLVKVIGRLRPGVSIKGASAALAPLFERFVETAPVRMRLRVQSLRDQQTQEAWLASWVLLGSVIAVLLIACANVANLQLARSASRRREMAVRAALGAARRRLIFQSLTESLVLALCGGALGSVLAAGLLRTFVAIAPEGILRLNQAGLDLRVLAFSVCASLLSGVLFGLAPAFVFSRTAPLSVRTATGQRRDLLRQVLVAAQIAASLVLLTSAGMLIATLWKFQHTPLGIESERVLTVSFTLSRYRYADNARQIEFFEQLERKLKQIPGVVAAAITDSLPPGGDPRSRPFVALANPGGSSSEQGMGGTVIWRYITPEYFDVMRIPIVRGRGFTAEDRLPGGQAIILSQALAARLFPNHDPIGRRVGSDVVVGVAADVTNAGVAGRIDPEHYLVRKHQPDQVFRNQRPPYGWRQAVAVIRTSADETAMAAWVRSAFRDLDPALPIEMQPMSQQVGSFIQRPRFHAVVLGLFAAIATLLAAVGIYGLVSYLVTERTQEIGVRMAVGATPRDVTTLMLSHALGWTIAGSFVGLFGSYWAARAISTLLYGAAERNLATMLLAAAMLVIVAAFAAWLPSRRASSVDPSVALRHE